MRLQSARLVFIDETGGGAGAATADSAYAPVRRWGTQTSPRSGGTSSPPRVVDGAIDRTAFNSYVETQLAPTLRPGDVAIADNLWSTKAPTSPRL